MFYLRKKARKAVSLILCMTFILTLTFPVSIFAEGGVVSDTAKSTKDAFQEAVKKIVVSTFKQQIEELAPQIIEIIKPQIDLIAPKIVEMTLKQRELSKNITQPKTVSMPEIPTIPSEIEIPEGFDSSQIPEGYGPPTGIQIPEGFDPTQIPEGYGPPAGVQMPEGFDPSKIPAGYGPPTISMKYPQPAALDETTLTTAVKKAPTKEEIQAQVKSQIENSFKGTIESVNKQINAAMSAMAPKIKELIKPVIKAVIPQINDLIESKIEANIEENIEAGINDLIKLVPEEMKDMTPAQIAAEFKESMREEVEAEIRPIIEKQIKDKVNEYIRQTIDDPITQKLAPKLEDIEKEADEQILAKCTPQTEEYVPQAFIKQVVMNQVKNIVNQIPELVEKNKAKMKKIVDEYIDNEIKDQTKIYIGNIRVESDVAPRIMNDRMMMPFRAIAESLGAKVDWIDETSGIIMTKGDKQIKMTLGSNDIVVNGEQKTMDVTPVIVEERTMVPVRFVAENLGLDVKWQGNWNMVSLTPIEN